MAPISSVCNTKYLRVPVDGNRPHSAVHYIVLHDTEGGTAESIARYFKTNSGGYTHLVVDDKDCYRSLRNAAIPRGAPGANYHGFHIEQVGFAKWSLPIWKKHILTIQRAAYKTALHCHEFHIPPVFIEAPELKAGAYGITTHAECTKAFGPVGGHTDPGPFWPRRIFMFYVKRYYNYLKGGELT